MILPDQLLLKNDKQHSDAGFWKDERKSRQTVPASTSCNFHLCLLSVEALTVMYLPHLSHTPTLLWADVSVSEGKRRKLPRHSGRHRIWVHVSALERAGTPQTQQDPRKLSLQVSPLWFHFLVKDRNETFHPRHGMDCKTPLTCLGFSDNGNLGLKLLGVKTGQVTYLQGK